MLCPFGHGTLIVHLITFTLKYSAIQWGHLWFCKVFGGNNVATVIKHWLWTTISWGGGGGEGEGGKAEGGKAEGGKGEGLPHEKVGDAGWLQGSSFLSCRWHCVLVNTWLCHLWCGLCWLCAGQPVVGQPRQQGAAVRGRPTRQIMENPHAWSHGHQLNGRLSQLGLPNRATGTPGQPVRWMGCLGGVLNRNLGRGVRPTQWNHDPVQDTKDVNFATLC